LGEADVRAFQREELRVLELTLELSASPSTHEHLFGLGAEVEREKEFGERTAIVDIARGSLLLEIVKILAQKEFTGSLVTAFQRCPELDHVVSVGKGQAYPHCSQLSVDGELGKIGLGFSEGLHVFRGEAGLYFFRAVEIIQIVLQFW
jgi:hypothetical protein